MDSSSNCAGSMLHRSKHQSGILQKIPPPRATCRFLARISHRLPKQLSSNPTRCTGQVRPFLLDTFQGQNNLDTDCTNPCLKNSQFTHLVSYLLIPTLNSVLAILSRLASGPLSFMLRTARSCVITTLRPGKLGGQSIPNFVRIPPHHFLLY